MMEVNICIAVWREQATYQRPQKLYILNYAFTIYDIRLTLTIHLMYKINKQAKANQEITHHNKSTYFMAVANSSNINILLLS